MRINPHKYLIKNIITLINPHFCGFPRGFFIPIKNIKIPLFVKKYNFETLYWYYFIYRILIPFFNYPFPHYGIPICPKKSNIRFFIFITSN